MTPTNPMPYSQPYARVERHLTVLGILWMLYGAFPLLGWMVALPFVVRPFGLGLFPFHHSWGGLHPGPFVAAWIPFVTAILFLIFAASFIVGFALLRRLPWGRALAIGYSFVMIFHPPWGTALSIYTWWVLMPQDSAWEYQRLSATL